MMYFDFEDRRPDTPILDRSLTRLETVPPDDHCVSADRHRHHHLPAAPVREGGGRRAAEAARRTQREQARGDARADAVRVRQAEGRDRAAAQVAEVPLRREPQGADDGEGAEAEERHPVLARQHGREDRSPTPNRPQPDQQQPQQATGAAGDRTPNALRAADQRRSRRIARNDPSKNPTLGQPAARA